LAGAEKDKRDGQASSRDQESVEHQDATGYGALRLSWPQATQHRRGGRFSYKWLFDAGFVDIVKIMRNI